MALYEVIGSNAPEYLLADPIGANKFAIPVEPGNDVIQRGTVMYRKSTGLWAPAAAGNISASYYLAIIDETVDSNAIMTVAEDAAAYRAGRFVSGRVFVGGGTTPVNDAQKLILRQQGMFFDVADDAAEFDNGYVTITYKGNNDKDEPDYTDYAKNESTYSVLANSTTKFTAPTGDAFSKWNTKADGSGTDYSAAGTYSATADLTLYAIWA